MNISFGHCCDCKPTFVNIGQGVYVNPEYIGKVRVNSDGGIGILNRDFSCTDMVKPQDKDKVLKALNIQV